MVNYLSAFTDMIGPLFAPHIIILLPGVASQKKNRLRLRRGEACGFGVALVR